MIYGCRKCVTIDYACWAFIVNCSLMNCPRSLWSPIYSNMHDLFIIACCWWSKVQNANISHNQQLSRTRKSCFRFQFKNYWFFSPLSFATLQWCLLKFISFVLLFSCNYLFLHSFHFNFILPRSFALLLLHMCYFLFWNNFTLHDCEFKCAKSINLWVRDGV